MKASLTKAQREKRNSVFSAIPANKIRSIIEKTPTGPAFLPQHAGASTGSFTQRRATGSILMDDLQQLEYPPAQQDPNCREDHERAPRLALAEPIERVSVYDPGAEKEGGLKPNGRPDGWQ